MVSCQVMLREPDNAVLFVAQHRIDLDQMMLSAW